MTLMEIQKTTTNDLKKRHRKIRNSINHDDCIEAVLIEKELLARNGEERAA